MNTFRNKQFKNELDPKYAFYDCLVNLYFKKNYVLGGFQGQKYSFKNRFIYLVITTT